MSPTPARSTPAYSSSAQAALLKAVCLYDAYNPLSTERSPLTAQPSQGNRLFHLERPVESLDKLADGILLGHILHELDAEFNISDLDATATTSKYLVNKRNLQIVYKGLFRFIRNHVADLRCQASKFDYKAIAENPEPQGISQLLAVMVSAAAMGPGNQKYVPRIQNGLDRETQAEIMQIIRTMQQDSEKFKGDDDLSETIDAAMEARDIDLVVEEQVATLHHELDVTKKTLSDYITRLEYLQQSHEELKYEKEKNDRELEVLRKATQDGANSAESIKVLEAQVHEQMEIIAKNEETIRQTNRIKAHLESEVQRLTQKSIQHDELRDQVTEWKHKAEELEKKANTADRFKQKLEAQQHLVKEVQNLQYEKADLQEQLRSILEDRERSDRTRKAEDELTKMITQSEQHLWDERNQKTQLMRDLAAAEEELMRLRAQRSHDERYIQEQEEQLQQAQTAVSQAGASNANFSLEDELNTANIAPKDEGQTKLPLEISRLKAENELLRSTLGSTGDAALMRRELDEEKRQRARLQQNYNDVFEKLAVAQDQIEALIKNATGEGLVKALDEVKSSEGTHILTGQYYRELAFINLRTEFLQASFEVEQLKKREKDLVAQVADQGRELLAARTLLSAVDKDTVEALNDLRGTDKVISESLKSENDRLREELSYSTSERDAQKSQLIEALLAKDKLRKEVEEGKEVQDAQGVAADPDVAEANKKSSEKVEKLRARLIECRQVSEDCSFSTPQPETWPSVEVFPDPFDVAEAEMDNLPAVPDRLILNEPAIPREPLPSQSPTSGKSDWAPGKGRKLRERWARFASLLRPYVEVF